MVGKWTKSIAVVGFVALLTAGTALAQAPDQERAGRGKGGGPGGAHREKARDAMHAVMGVASLLGHENAEIKNTKGGVDVTITAEDDVEELQDEVQERLDAFLEAAADIPQRRRDGDGDRPAHLPMLLMQGQASVTARNTDNGVVLSLKADDPEVAKKIQEGAPEWQERAQKMHQMRDRMRKHQEARQLLGQDDVDVQTEQPAQGLTVTITSDNAETRARIQELLPGFFTDVQQMRRDRDRDRDEDGMGRERDKGAGRGRGRRRDDDKEDEDDDE